MIPSRGQILYALENHIGVFMDIFIYESARRIGDQIALMLTIATQTKAIIKQRKAPACVAKINKSAISAARMAVTSL